MLLILLSILFDLSCIVCIILIIRSEYRAFKKLSDKDKVIYALSGFGV